MVAVPAGADMRAEVSRCSSSLPFPGFPSRAAPPPVAQLLVASIEPSPAFYVPPEAFFRADCAEGLPPSTAPHRRSDARKRLHARMNLELIWVTG